MSKIQNKQLNLLQAYEHSFEDPHKKDKYKMFILPSAMIAVLLVFFIVMTVLTANVKNSTSSIKKEIATKQAALTGTDATSYDELQKMTTALSDIQTIDKKINSYIPMSKKKLMKLLTLASGTDVTVTAVTYSRDGAKVTLSAQTPSVTNVEKYVSLIRANSYYSSVSYTGYSGGSTTSSTATGATDPTTGEAVTTEVTSAYYSFDVSMKLKGGSD